MVGPLEPFSLGKNVDFEWMVQSNAREDSPFRHYKIVPYAIAAADGIQFVYQDAYGNLFVKPDENNPESYTYLSEDESRTRCLTTVVVNFLTYGGETGRLIILQWIKSS